MRFQTKLMLVFILLLLTVVGLMAFLNYRNAKRLLGEVEADLQEIVNTVHFSTRKLSSEKGPDREFLEKFIEEFKAKKGVKEVSIVSNRHEVIASSNPKRIGRQEQGLSGKEIVVQEQFGVPDSGKEPGSRRIRYEVRMPLIRDDRVIGLVQTSISLTDFRHLLREAYVKNLSIAMTALLFACGASFFILHRLNKPIRILSAAAEKVAFGDLTVRIRGLGRDEMGRLAYSFNGMILKLAEQKELEDRLRHMERQAILAELASALAHEIRNPLNLINLTADHLGDQFRPEDAQRREDYLGLVSSLKSEVKHLNHVVGDFIALGRPRKLQKARFRLEELIDQVEVMVKQQLATKGVGFKSECPPDLRLVADQEQLRLVLLNLLLNAIEAVAPGGNIILLSRLDGLGNLRLTVSDDGKGVEPGNLELIFEPYFTKRDGGTGLGLALVRRILEEHGGRIVASNNPEGGLTMELSLPAEA
ncbi:MAG TPA: ATP-binding protein [Fibrobacteria bacterium]|nr:ATP-binding protein [Fibrobacteria bacterium]